jgi:hypothetical protein
VNSSITANLWETADPASSSTLFIGYGASLGLLCAGCAFVLIAGSSRAVYQVTHPGAASPPVVFEGGRGGEYSDLPAAPAAGQPLMGTEDDIGDDQL